MVVRRLDERQAAALRAAPWSYAPVGGPVGDTPAGYTALTRTVTLARRDFDVAARELLGWQVHERAGLRVEASDVAVVPGGVVLLRWGPGPMSLAIPCRVVRVVDEATRQGFAYGTLPGHPEAGEEEFLLERHEDGHVVFTVTAFSRPASRAARWSGPAGRAAQRLMTRRYLRALDRG